MNISRKAIIVGLLLLTTAACKEAQLGGPVTNAEIFIDLLHQPGANFQLQATNRSADIIDVVGLAEWVSMSNEEKFLRVGNFEADHDQLDPNSLYLVEARYGSDTDANRDRKYDTTKNSVAGSWRAIMSGEELMANANLVSALTEAAYQYVYQDVGLLSDEELRVRLDEFAQLVISDVDKDGDVDYSDVLRWTRVYSEEQYLGDISFLDNLITIITQDEDEDEYIRYAAAASVWNNSPIEPLDPDDREGTMVGGGTINEDVFWTEEGSPYILTQNINANADIYIQGGAEIQGHNKIILLFGNLYIEGLPRNPARIFDLNLNLNNFGGGEQSRIRFAYFEDGGLTSKTRQFVMEDSRTKRWELDIRGVTNSNDHFAEIRRNVFDRGSVLFNNRDPEHNLFEAEFVNNRVTPPDTTNFSLVTEWEGPKGNLTVEHNTFHANMRVLRGLGDPVLSVQNNYWGAKDKDDLDFDSMIPNNEPDGDFARIFYLPILEDPHPGTPPER